MLSGSNFNSRGLLAIWFRVGVGVGVGVGVVDRKDSGKSLTTNALLPEFFAKARQAGLEFVVS